MKKRYIAAAGLVASLTGLYILGSKVNETCVPGNADYEAGTGICNAKNAASDAAEVVAKAEAAAKAKEASKWQPTAYNISNLALACENSIKPVLKDPGSFRRLDEGMSDLTDNKVTVWVNYSATNSFGGRVQNTKSCTYTR